MCFGSVPQPSSDPSSDPGLNQRNDEATRTQAGDQRRRRAGAIGRSALIVTGGLGDLGTASVQRTALLGA